MLFSCRPANSKRLAACAFRHKLAAFLCRFYCLIGAPCAPGKQGETTPLSCRLLHKGINTLDFGSKVVCHETPARFLWILPAQRAGPRLKSKPAHQQPPRQSTRGSRIFRPSWVSQMRSSSALYQPFKGARSSLCGAPGIPGQGGPLSF